MNMRDAGDFYGARNVRDLDDFDAMQEQFDNDHEDACYMLRHAWDKTATCMHQQQRSNRQAAMLDIKRELLQLIQRVDAIEQRARHRVTRSVTNDMREVMGHMQRIMSELTYM